MPEPLKPEQIKGWAAENVPGGRQMFGAAGDVLPTFAQAAVKGIMHLPVELRRAFLRNLCRGFKQERRIAMARAFRDAPQPKLVEEPNSTCCDHCGHEC